MCFPHLERVWSQQNAVIPACRAALSRESLEIMEFSCAYMWCCPTCRDVELAKCCGAHMQGCPTRRWCRTSKVWQCMHARLSTWRKCSPSGALRAALPRCSLGSRQLKQQGGCMHIWQPSPHRQLALEQEGKEACTYQTAPPRTYSVWSSSTPGTPRALPNYNWTAKTIQHTVYTEATFSRLGEIGISCKS